MGNFTRYAIDFIEDIVPLLSDILSIVRASVERLDWRLISLGKFNGKSPCVKFFLPLPLNIMPLINYLRDELNFYRNI